MIYNGFEYDHVYVFIGPKPISKCLELWHVLLFLHYILFSYFSMHALNVNLNSYIFYSILFYYHIYKTLP